MIVAELSERNLPEGTVLLAVQIAAEHHDLDFVPLAEFFGDRKRICYDMKIVEFFPEPPENDKICRARVKRDGHSLPDKRKHGLRDTFLVGKILSDPLLIRRENTRSPAG